MAITKKKFANLIQTGARIWKAPVGEALPDVDTIGYGVAFGGNWDEVGYTSAPLAIGYTEETNELRVEQRLGPAYRLRSAEDIMFETTLAEIHSLHLDMLIGDDAGTNVTEQAAGAGAVEYDSFQGGGVYSLPEAAWGVEGKVISTEQPIRFFIYRATAHLNGQLEFAKGNPAGMNIQVKGLVDETKSLGVDLFEFQRVTAAATS